MPCLTPDPVRIAYERTGRGPLVVFLHGIGGNRSNWDEQLQGLSDRFCTVAWDARGYGASDDPPTPLAFSHYADDLQRLLDHLEAERAHIVGLSMGGMIAQDFYARYPDRIATLTLADTSSGFGSAPEEVRQDFLTKRLAPLEAGLTFRDIADGLVAALVSPSASPPVAARLRASLEALRPEPYKQAVKAIITTDFRSVLPRIAVPTLVLVGSDDQIIPPPVSQALAAAIPAAQLVVIENAGHLTNIEQPEAFNATLGAFLDRHATRASTVDAA